MLNQEGRVLWGANNIFYVLPIHEDVAIECRFKGKKLKSVEDEHNALVPGDKVIFERQDGRGMIIERLDRTNSMTRWNKKNRSPQAFAANIDLCCIVTSPESPPFRPRFIDRCLVTADHAGITPLIILNKIDQGYGELVSTRIANYQTLGYTVLAVSAQDGQGIQELIRFLQDKISLFMGQSGVGKSSLLKAISPLADPRVGEVSEKFNRGRHTTVLAKSYHVPGLGEVIDSPGVREFEPALVPSQALSHLFTDITPFIGNCGHRNCSHTVEPDCGVRRAAMEGLIDEDRYESYLRLFEALVYQEKNYQ